MLRIYNRGVVFDKKSMTAYILDGVDYDGGFRSGSGFVLEVDEAENYAAVHMISEEGELIRDHVVAVLEDYSYCEGVPV